VPAGPPPMIGTFGDLDIVSPVTAAYAVYSCRRPHGSPEWGCRQACKCPVLREKLMVSIQFEHDLKEAIRTIPDYPKPGIMFRDITTLLGNARAFRRAVDELVQPWAGMKIDKVAGIEARGFILGGAVAHQVSAGFVPIRKKGKLPHKRVSIAYSLEYGLDEMEMHEDAVENGDRVILVDDLIATGGTAEGAVKLLRQLGAQVLAACFIIDLPDLGGADKLRKLDVSVRTLITFEGH
jgi:adenine phosphoribosyltransferase